MLAFIQGKAPSAAEAALEEQPARVKGRVVIVGAGPAGLAAAMHLKVGLFPLLTLHMLINQVQCY